MYRKLAIVLIAVVLAGCSRESRKARHLERATRYYQAGEIDKAEIEYANVLRLEGTNKVAIRQLGLIYFDQGKPARAYPLLSQAAELDANDTDVRLKLASLYLAGNKFDDARAQAEHILQKQPGHDEALVLLADTARDPVQMQAVRERLENMRAQLVQKPGFHLALGSLAFRQKKFAEAEAAFKEAIRIESRMALAHSMLGNLYVSQERLAAADAAYRRAFDLSPLRSSRRFDYIDFKVRNGDAAAGKKLLEELVQKAPDHLPALNRLAELNLARKDYSATAALIAKVLARDPRNYEALLTQGLLHLAQADSPKAIAHFQRMNGIFPTVPKVPYHLALAFLGTNNTTEAIAYLNQAIRLDPEYAEPVLLLAQIDIRKGDTAAAIGLASDLVRKRPRLAEAHLLLANAYRARNDLDEAVDVYARMAEMYPRNAQVPLLMGGVFLQQNRTNEARRAFEASLQLAPNYLPALEQVVGLDLAQRQFTAAVDRIRKELERNPAAPALYILLAKAYYEQGQTNSVEKELLRAIELDPQQREPYVLLARLYIDRNEHDQAIDRLKSLTARTPSDLPALMLLGMIYHQLNNFTSERDMYEKVLAFNPRFGLALNNLAYLYSEQLQQLDRAFEMAQRARALAPWDPHSADTLGWILFKRQEYSWALSLLQESADKLPNQPEILFHLGMAEYMMGYENAARTSLQRALQSRKDFKGRHVCAGKLAILDIDVSNANPANLAGLVQKLAPEREDPIALAKLGIAYERSANIQKARHTYEQALSLNPKNVTVMLRLARLLAERPEDFGGAMELARRARMLAPDDPAIAHAVGRIALKSRHGSEHLWAHSLLQESARKLPDNPDVAYDLAWTHLSLGQVPEAEASMRIALQQPFGKSGEARGFLDFLGGNASDSAVKNTLERQPDHLPALFASARACERQGKVTPVREAYEAILNRFPLFVPAHKRLAIFYEADGNLVRAMHHASEARERAPNDPETARILGIISFKRGEFARAAQLLRESARLGQADSELFYYMGMAFYRLKRPAESKEALKHALTLNVAPSLADEANRVLAELN